MKAREVIVTSKIAFTRLRPFALFSITTLTSLMLVLGHTQGARSGERPTFGSAKTVALVHCGTERWAAKTLSDGVAIDFNHPTITTVSKLGNVTPPSGAKGMNARRTPEETRVYTVHALLQKYKLEANDNDFHVVISDFGGPTNITMIAEIPDSICEGVSGDGWTAEFDSMRSAIETSFGTAKPSMRTVNAEVTITGVLFFDFPHGQTGHAPNFVELHPVLALKFGAAGPQPTAAPSTSPTSSPTGPIVKFDTEAAAQQHCPNDVVVWLNTRSGFYHLKGHRYYGGTVHGAFVCEKDAVRAGYHEGY
ncbi:MAG TPA: hypothetical protein VN934_05855 [Candidatus Tumulicola sp.]|nr:hypothetical protein [Candidatus Tumulicola sp.]